MARQAIWIFFFIIISITGSLTAQDGHTYINNFELPGKLNEQKISALAIGEDNAAFIAGAYGVHIFDGSRLISVSNKPKNVLSLARDSSAAEVYVGLKNGFGYIKQTETGNYRYFSLFYDKQSHCEITEILFTDKFVFFYGDSRIYQYNKSEKKISEKISPEEGRWFAGSFVHRNKLYVNIGEKGIAKYEEGELKPLYSGRKFKDAYVLFGIRYNFKNTLIGTDDNRIYLFNGKGFKQFAAFTEIRNFLEENILRKGIDYSQNYFALTTLTGGCVLIDKNYGKTKHTINYQTGLPDDEITAVAKDSQNGIWLAHPEGLSVFDLEMPVKNFSSYPGNNSNINDLIFTDKRLYIATNAGVFELKDDTRNNRKIEYVRKKVSKPVYYTTTERTGFLNLKKKKVRKKRYKTSYELVPKITSKKGEKTKAYVKIKNLNQKCKHLYRFRNRLLAVSDFGVYELKDSIAEPVVTDLFCYDLTAEQDTDILYTASHKGIQKLSYHPAEEEEKDEQGEWKNAQLFDELNEPVYSLAKDQDGNLWFGTEGKAFIARPDTAYKYRKPEEIPFEKEINEEVIVKNIGKQIIFVQSSGIYRYKPETNNIVFDRTGEQNILGKDNLWLTGNKAIQVLDTSKAIYNTDYLKLFNKLKAIYKDADNNIWLLNGKNGVFKIPSDTAAQKKSKLKISFLSLRDNTDSLYILQKPVFEYENNSLHFSYTAPSRYGQNSTEYRYKIEGFDNFKKWSDWSKQATLHLSFVPPGNYTLHIQARNILGQKSNIESLSFEVLEPFWQSNWFYLIMSVLLLILLYLVYYLSRLRLRIKNKRLEKIVAARTAELSEKNVQLQTQKEEIEAQRDKVIEQKNEIELQKERIEKQKRNIEDSIEYARNIQQAIMPPMTFINKIAPQNFILYKPKDVVSGDFYWFAQKHGKLYFAAADCTGHGVPGAFVSMLGVSFLNEILSSAEKDISPSEILNRLKSKIIKALHQTGDADEAKDGMDMALCRIDTKNMRAMFAGAFNPLYIARNGKIIEYSGDKQPIGIFDFEEKTTLFTNHEFELRKNDTLYVFSDGYPDQFGGKRDRKFNIGNLKKLILKMQDMPLAQQHKKMDEVIENWRAGVSPQIDDILVIGVKI